MGGIDLYYIGIDIGGTKCAASIACCKGSVPKIINKIKFPTSSLTPQEILKNFSAFIDEQIKTYKIDGIGISCGGPLDSRRGVIMSPPSLPLWDNIEIVKYFEDKYSIPTRLQNDANACAVAEWRYGAGRDSKNMVFLTFGTGLGAGLILDGKLYVGTNDNAGEIGHVRLTPDGPVGYGKRGSCEGYCSGGGIARFAKLLATQNRYAASAAKFYAEIGGENSVNAKNIAEYARKKNAFCRAVYRRCGQNFGRTLSILVDLLNPELIVVGGVFMRDTDLILPECLKVMEKECLSYSKQVVSVVGAELGENVGDFAAIAVAQGEY